MRLKFIFLLNFLIFISCSAKSETSDFSEVIQTGYSYSQADQQFTKQSFKNTLATNSVISYSRKFEVTGYTWNETVNADVFYDLIERCALYGSVVEFKAGGIDLTDIRLFTAELKTNSFGIKYRESGVYGGKLLFLNADVYFSGPGEPAEFKDVAAVDIGVDLPMRDCDGEWSPYFIKKIKNINIEFLREILRAELERQFGEKIPSSAAGKMYFVSIPVQGIKDGFFNYHVKVKVKFE